jgi:Cadherin domain
VFIPFSASNIRYKITSGNIGNVFGVHNTTGAIYIAGELDYEKLKKVNVNASKYYLFSSM